MQCPCGQETGSQSHEVSTLAKAVEWFPDTFESDLPIKVDQDKCPACGRFKAKIFDWQGNKIHERG